MLYERIKLFRKKKGLTQEALAARLNVVRQTISKWEKGYSVPDADMITKLADVLDVSVNDLLGSKTEKPEEIDRLMREFSHINEQLVQKNRRSKRVLQVFALVFFLNILLGIIWVCFGVFGIRNATDPPAYVRLDGIDQEVDPNIIPIETSNP